MSNTLYVAFIIGVILFVIVYMSNNEIETFNTSGVEKLQTQIDQKMLGNPKPATPVAKKPTSPQPKSQPSPVSPTPKQELPSRVSLSNVKVSTNPEPVTPPKVDTKQQSPNRPLTTLDAIHAYLQNAPPEVISKFEYIEKLESIPGYKDLLIYLSTFSDKTYYDHTTPNYVAQSQRFNNFLDENQSFFLLTNNALPNSVRPPNGLPLKGTRINGIRSDLINQNDYLLGSFSVSFYLKVNNIVFPNGNDIEILDIFVESPYFVRISFSPGETADNVNIALNIGSSLFVIPMPISTLQSGANRILFTMTYDDSQVEREDEEGATQPIGVVSFYIGDEKYANKIVPKPEIILGNSPIRINKSGNMDATFHAFMFFKSAITFETHKALRFYFDEQFTGINNVIRMVNAMQKEQEKVIKSYVTEQTNLVARLKKQLETCNAKQIISKTTDVDEETDETVVSGKTSAKGKQKPKKKESAGPKKVVLDDIPPPPAFVPVVKDEGFFAFLWNKIKGIFT
jgi:hypothetical protein